jgi:ATP-dependent Clp protease ATP-binding subunit ClpX
MTEKLTHCSFCTKHKDQVAKLIVSHQVAICSECVELCNNLLEGTTNNNSSNKKISVPDPSEICKYLDQHVVGQEQAKRVLSVAIANHFKRIKNPDNNVTKTNIMMIGPTGTGKTLMAKTVAKYLNVPFIVGDATCLTEAGYVGDDVESLIARLYAAANNDVEACQQGIIFLDEIDKIARKSESATVSRDVSGEGVQQALLKLVEGTKCRVPVNMNRKSSNTETVEIDTTNILFIASGAFVGLEKIVQNRLQGSSIGFGANLSSTENQNHSVIPDDLVKYGMIPEFVGRFNSYVNLHDLTKKQLVSILTQVDGNLVQQYCWLFDQDGVTLEFEPESLEIIADLTLKTQTGARGLHRELERVLLPHMFDLPKYRKQNIVKVTINKTQVNTPMTLAQENQ